jgi:hypothetical protein
VPRRWFYVLRPFLRDATLAATSSHIYGRICLVRTTVDIPDALYRQLKSQAAREKRSVKELILRAISAELRAKAKKRSSRVVFPLVSSKAPGNSTSTTLKSSSSFLFPDPHRTQERCQSSPDSLDLFRSPDSRVLRH